MLSKAISQSHYRKEGSYMATTGERLAGLWGRDTPVQRLAAVALAAGAAFTLSGCEGGEPTSSDGVAQTTASVVQDSGESDDLPENAMLGDIRDILDSSTDRDTATKALEEYFTEHLLDSGESSGLTPEAVASRYAEIIQNAVNLVFAYPEVLVPNEEIIRDNSVPAAVDALKDRIDIVAEAASFGDEASKQGMTSVARSMVIRLNNAQGIEHPYSGATMSVTSIIPSANPADPTTVKLLLSDDHSEVLVTLRIKVGRIRAESGCGSAEGPDIASVVTALAATPIAGTMARAPICSARGAQRDRAASSVGERSAAPAPLRIRLGHVPPRRAGAVSSGLQSDAGEGIEDACSAACGDATEGLRWRWPRLSTERGRLSTLLVDPSRKVGTCSSGLGPACKWRVTGPRWNVARSFVLPTRPLIPEGSSCLLPIPLLLCDPRYHGPGGHCYCPMPWMPLGVGVSTS